MNQTKNYGLKKPEVSEFFKLADWNENFDKIDSEIKSKEDKIEEIANTEFTVADKRENIASKEKMPKILGKIAKWFSDLKTVAFSGSYNDLSDKPIVDANISSTSTNPVQNKVIKAYVDKKASENVDFSTSMSKLLNGTVEAPLVLSNATRNLLNPTLETITKNGVTCTNNGDGTYTLNGTATKDNWISFAGITLNPGKYKFIATENNVRVNNLCVALNSTNIAFPGSKFTIQSKCVCDIGLSTHSNTFNNVLIKPMITTDLDATYDDFVHYSGYDIKTCGKNLINLTKITTANIKGATASLSNGIITLNGTVNTSGGWQDLYFASAEQHVSLKKGIKYTISTKDKVQKVFIMLRNNRSGVVLYSHDCSTNGTTFVASQDMVCQVTVTFKESSTFNNTQIVPQLEVGEKGTEYEHYQDGGTVHIDSTTEFPLLGLKSFNGETNIISPGNVEVTYAKSDSGAAIVDTLKKSVSDGKTKVANAITVKGVTTATDATFDVMAENISKIDTELHGATLAVRTSDGELYGKTVTLTLNGGNVGATAFANNGTCSFVVQKPGAYTVTCGEAHKNVTVTSDNVLNKTTILVNLLLLKIVTFSGGTDEEIAKMIQAHYNNKINIADYWAVGDTRSVSLSAMSPSTVSESHRAQTVQFVIADFEHDTLANDIGSHSKAAITLLQKDCLMDAANASNPVDGYHNTENGYMRGSSTNVGGWDASARRGWCNDTYFNALPATWRSMVKTVIKYTGRGGGLSGTQSTLDKIFLPSEIEIFGDTNSSAKGEGRQYQYYKNAAVNKYKMPKWDTSSKHVVSSVYLERSPVANNKVEFCFMWADGGMVSQGASVSAGIAPMMCV